MSVVKTRMVIKKNNNVDAERVTYSYRMRTCCFPATCFCTFLIHQHVSLPSRRRENGSVALKIHSCLPALTYQSEMNTDSFQFNARYYINCITTSGPARTGADNVFQGMIKLYRRWIDKSVIAVVHNHNHK
jgi:hypothetical protein